MISKEIHEWLIQQGSYKEGLRLHARIGSAKVHRYLQQYLSFPKLPASAYQELAAALQQYLAKYPISTQTSVIGFSAKKDAAPIVEHKNEDAQMRLLVQRRNALLRERDAHRAQLVQMVSDADKYTENDRYMLCHTIMTIQEEIDEAQQQIEAYRESGVVVAPGFAKRIQREAVAKYQRLQTLRSAISRIRARLKTDQPAAKRKADENELLAKQVEAKQIEEELCIGS